MRTKDAFFWAPEKDYVARYQKHPTADGYTVVVEDHGNGMERGVRIPIQPAGFVKVEETDTQGVEKVDVLEKASDKHGEFREGQLLETFTNVGADLHMEHYQ